jgi:hypothetical protein
MGAQIVNGSTLRSATLEKAYLDLANHFATYQGVVFGNVGLNVAVGQVLTGTFGTVGKRELWAIPYASPPSTTINDEELDENTTAVTFTVTASGLFNLGDILQRSGSTELMLVTAAAGTSVTVTRGYAGSTVALLSDGDSISALYSATSAGTGYDAAPTNDVMNAVDDVFAVLENGSELCVQSVGMALQNNLRQRMCVGELGLESIGAGKATGTGTLQMYNSARSQGMVRKYLDFESTSIAVVTLDGAGNAMVFEFPEVKLTQGPRNATGANTDVVFDLAFSAKKDPVEGITMRVVRFPAA